MKKDLRLEINAENVESTNRSERQYVEERTALDDDDSGVEDAGAQMHQRVRSVRISQSTRLRIPVQTGADGDGDQKSA